VLCCAVLCCAVLCCAVLCCAVLCCAVLCCAVLCCAVLCCAVCSGALLTRWPFHQCLLACSFEVVAASYRMGLLPFPAIPSRLGLKPFDLCKMVGPFVKAEPTLPR
jgi:hypothetical protein